jgi:hypothetical protein
VLEYTTREKSWGKKWRRGGIDGFSSSFYFVFQKGWAAEPSNTVVFNPGYAKISYGMCKIGREKKKKN